MSFPHPAQLYISHTICLSNRAVVFLIFVSIVIPVQLSLVNKERLDFTC